MIIRHSKKTLFMSAAAGLAIFTGVYFIFERFLTNAFYIYLIGFIISLITCFGPFIKDYFKYRFNYLEIDDENISVINLWSKVVIPLGKFADYKIYSGIYEKIIKVYDIEFYTVGGEAYSFKMIDKEINFRDIFDKLRGKK